jgi:hypothetical protein
MKTIVTQNYYAEDLVPLSIIRGHLRYEQGEADGLINSYLEAAMDYMLTVTNRVFCSSAPASHEDSNYNLASVSAKNSTVVVYLDRLEVKEIQTLRNITGTYTVEAIDYLDTSGDYVAYVDDKARVRNTGYPIQVDFTGTEPPVDLNEDQDYDLYKITLSGGENVKDLPKQFTQAALMLIGHYDSHREAEFFGGITTEVKEGVQRLLGSVKRY